MPSYRAPEIEQKWQEKWDRSGLYSTDLSGDSRDKYYNLVMFPYPSGDKLHVGHWYNYAPADSWGRYMRMKGFNVLQPMGFDAFGLPAENYAIKTGIAPQESTDGNVGRMIEQLKRIGCMYDWDKMVNTSSPEYYKWTQWLFIQMFENDLAYKKRAKVNFCPSCQTVLANEQVWEGTCERCKNEVEQKNLEQWFWKTTAYAQRLLDGLEDLDWPEKTKLMQRNWIGRSEGAEVDFDVLGHDDKIRVFTTRPDTLFGATYMVLAPEHQLVNKIVSESQKEAVEAYKKAASAKNELQRTDLAKDKSGIFSGAYAINPVNGENVPIWIADYVLINYGTGAIMAVPGHDERDWEFAKKYEIKIIEVVEGGNVEEAAYTGDGKHVNSEFLDGLGLDEAKKKITEWLGSEDKGESVITYRLRDWLLSRQRYWGAPIPIVYDPDGKAHPVPEEHLPWMLPTDVEFKPEGTSPLGQSEELKQRVVDIFGEGWTPEIDTMDTFVCSSWYYLRYLDSQNEGSSWQKDIAKNWMPVDMYIGGPEHACMHLIYARFVMMALNDFGFTSHGEPFQKLIHQGLVTKDGSKMSKSKGNVVSPDEFVEKYGSDVFRMYLMFMGPFTDGGDWSDQGITGIARFVDRFWSCVVDEREVKDEELMKKSLHKLIKKCTSDIEKFNFNTVIAAMMEFCNLVYKNGIDSESKKILVKLISPIAPHLAEECWEVLGNSYSVVDSEWPEFDAGLVVDSEVVIGVQVNGKVRGEINVATDASEDDVVIAARAIENIEKYLQEGEIRKVIYVPGRILGFVVK
jgi:leucyl-tRNA synthetase